MVIRSVTHNDQIIGSFSIQSNGQLRCSQGHLGAMRIYTIYTGKQLPPEFKCQSCSEIGFAFNTHGDNPLVIVPTQ